MYSKYSTNVRHRLQRNQWTTLNEILFKEPQPIVYETLRRFFVVKSETDINSVGFQ